jgi:hypothetical protein
MTGPATRMAFLTGMLLALSCGSNLRAEGEFWYPPWDGPRLQAFVVPSDKPNVFLTIRVKDFPTAKEAEAFQAGQKWPVEIKRNLDRHICTYREPLDLTPLLDDSEQKVDWSDRKAQYFLLHMLDRHYSPQCEIRGRIFYKSGSGYWDSENELAERAGPGGIIVEKEWRAKVGSERGLYASYLKPVDIVAEAAEKYRGLMAAYEYLIPERIGDYRCLGAGALGGPIPSKLGVRPGRSGGATYINNMTSGPRGVGAVVHHFMADEEDGLDHDFLRDMLLQGRAVVEQTADRQTVVVGKSSSGQIVAWKAGKRSYYQIWGGATQPVIEAYLRKFPSILPKDYSVDEMEWKRQELSLCYERLEWRVEQNGKEGEQYMWDYAYFLSFTDPVEEAPLFQPWLAKLTQEEREQHFRQVRAVKQMKGGFSVRVGRPLSYEEVTAKFMPRSHKETAECWRKLREAVRDWKAKHPAGESGAQP